MYPEILNIEICDNFERIFAIRDAGNIASIFSRSKAQKDAKRAQRAIIKNFGIRSWGQSPHLDHNLKT